MVQENEVAHMSAMLPTELTTSRFAASVSQIPATS
jgi:hypothetical protein